jgi:hypothetical protein
MVILPTGGFALVGRFPRRRCCSVADFTSCVKPICLTRVLVELGKRLGLLASAATFCFADHSFHWLVGKSTSPTDDNPAYGIGVIVRRLFRLHPSMVCHDSIGGSFREPSAIFDSGKSSKPSAG